MYRLKQEFTFEASHVLAEHDGKCSSLHGHSYFGALIIEGHQLHDTGPKENMLMDFNDINVEISKYIRLKYNYQHLNDVLESSMPTVELIAKTIYEDIKPHIPELKSVILHETLSSSCEYIGPKTVFERQLTHNEIQIMMQFMETDVAKRLILDTIKEDVKRNRGRSVADDIAQALAKS